MGFFYDLLFKRKKRKPEAETSEHFARIAKQTEALWLQRAANEAQQPSPFSTLEKRKKRDDSSTDSVFVTQFPSYHPGVYDSGPSHDSGSSASCDSGSFDGGGGSCDGSD